MQHFKYMQLIYIFCLSHLLHIYALSAAGQIREAESGFFFSFGFGALVDDELYKVRIASHIT